MAKAKHKHQYVLHKKHLHGDNFWELLNVCSVCGHTKKPPYKAWLRKATDGTYRWICRLSDIQEVYGDIPTYEEGVSSD